MDLIVNRLGFGGIIKQSMCKCLPYGWSNVIGEEPDIDDDIDELETLQAQQQTYVDNIKILSYNIFIRPPAPRFTHNVDDDYKDQRLDEFIKFYLQRYHVVCLQEMFGAFSNRRKRLISRARRMGFRWKITSPQRRSSGFLVDGGCIILSRLRIIRSRATVYQPGVFSDQLAAKGALYALLNPSPGVFIHLFSTHLQASYSDKAGEVAARVRQNQIDELINFIKKCTSEEDINTEEGIIDIIDDSNNIIKQQQQEQVRPKINSYGSSAASTSADSPINRAPSQEVIGRVIQSDYYDRQASTLNKRRKYPIILVGDFNCNARIGPHDSVDDSDEYKLIKSKLENIGVTEDVLFQQLGEHPVTYASAHFDDNDDDVTSSSIGGGGGGVSSSFVPSEKALTDPIDWSGHGEQTNQSLDYIFYFPPPSPCLSTMEDGNEEDEATTRTTRRVSSSSPSVVVSVKSAQVNSFNLTQRHRGSDNRLNNNNNNSPQLTPSHDPLQDFAFTQLSDHYGVEVELSLKNDEDGMR